jgi:hypothetical protein
MGASEKGRRPRRPYLVLDPLDAVEDDGAVPALDVVEAVHGGVHGGAAEHGDLDQRAGPRRGRRDPAAALHVHPRRARAWGRRRRRSWRYVEEEVERWGEARRLGFSRGVSLRRGNGEARP